MDLDSDFKTVRGYQLANRKEAELTSALEDYLEMTYRLCMQNHYARVGQLSELLHVKPSSASKMIFKLADLGYVAYDRYEIIMLTDKGCQAGAYLLSRHDTIEAFLKQIGSRDPLAETELIEHFLGHTTVANLQKLLDLIRHDPSVQMQFDGLMKEAPEDIFAPENA